MYGRYPDTRCDDCGVMNVYVRIIGYPQVPRDQTGNFCNACSVVRRTRADQQREPLPIGETKYFGRCKGRLVSIRYPASAIGPGDRSVSDAIMDIRTKLGYIEMHTTTTKHLVEFNFRWEDGLIKDDVESALNGLRARFPIVTIGVKR